VRSAIDALVAGDVKTIADAARVRAGAEAANFPSACFRVNTVLMKRQTVITKKRRGPAPTGKGTLVGVRLQPDRLSAVDAWIAKQDIPMTRPEAIRAMLDAVLVIVAKDSGEKQARKTARSSRPSPAETDRETGQRTSGNPIRIAREP
jgi:hypothetical protein